jgi:hypothetical protein
MIKYDRIPLNQALAIHPALRGFNISPLYALHQENAARAARCWPESYFNPGIGIYVISDAMDRLLYLGRSNWIGRRLSNYFGGRHLCRIKSDAWTARPAYVRMIAIPNVDLTKTIEWQLIGDLDPPDNLYGRRPRG